MVHLGKPALPVGAISHSGSRASESMAVQGEVMEVYSNFPTELRPERIEHRDQVPADEA